MTLLPTVAWKHNFFFVYFKGLLTKNVITQEMLHSLARRKDLFNLCKKAKLAYISSNVLYSMSCMYTVFILPFFTPWCAGWDPWVICTWDHHGRRPIGPPTGSPRQKRTGNISSSIFNVLNYIFDLWFELFLMEQELAPPLPPISSSYDFPHS